MLRVDVSEPLLNAPGSKPATRRSALVTASSRWPVSVEMPAVAVAREFVVRWAPEQPRTLRTASLPRGGVEIIGDQGCSLGCRLAVVEFLSAPGMRHHLSPIETEGCSPIER